jgi:zinc protease
MDDKLFQKKLPNGLELFHIQDPSAPVASIQALVGVGSADEKKGEEGLTHFIEHLLFKGTDRRDVGEIAKEVESEGGEMNAYTSFDETVFYITTATAYTEHAFDVLGDMMSSPRFDGDEIDREREVVIEEMRRGDDSPQSLLFKNLLGTRFKKHPYGRPVIGKKKVVSEVSRGEIIKYFNRYYSTGNMKLLSVGPHDFKEIEGFAKKYFKKIKKGRPRRPKRELEPEQKQFRYKSQRFDLQEAFVSIGFPIPNFFHDDVPLLELLMGVLGFGQSARLRRKLQEEEGVANGVTAGVFSGKEPGIAYVAATVPDGKLEEALSSFGREISNLIHHPIEDEEFSRLKNNFFSDLVYQKETVEGQASRVGHYLLLGADLSLEEKHMSLIQHATSEDLQRVAKEYLKPHSATLSYLFPEGLKKEPVDRKKAEKLFKDAFRSKIPAQKKKRKRSSKDLTYLETLSNGVRVAFHQKKGVPITSMELIQLGGCRFEKKGYEGMAHLSSLLLERGTEQKSFERFSNEMESMASSFGSFSGRNTMGLSLQCLSKHFDRSLSLAAESFFESAFTELECERVKRLTSERIKAENDDPVQICFRGFLKYLYGDHPYSYPVHGTEQSLKALTASGCKDFWSAMKNPKECVVSVCSDLDPETCLSSLEESLGQWQASQDNEKLVDRLHKVNSPAEETRVEFKKEREQAHVLLGYLGYRFEDEGVTALELISSILSGQGGRLFLELRDKKSLAYSLAPFKSEGIERGYFGVYIGCAPNKIEESIQGIQSELKKLVDKKVTRAELARSKKYILGREAIGLQRNAAFSKMIGFDEMYGLGAKAYMRRAKEIRAVTPDDISNVAKEIFEKQNPVISVVAPGGAA